MSVVALSPIGGEPTSPMITSVTMTHSDSLEEAAQRRAPPLHAGADWKVLLHLPEVQTWLRAAAGRVSQLTHSAGQDAEHRHIDTHLLQLKTRSSHGRSRRGCCHGYPSRGCRDHGYLPLRLLVPHLAAPPR
ncbi:unnamed protein product [Boreogadus saida]